MKPRGTGPDSLYDLKKSGKNAVKLKKPTPDPLLSDREFYLRSFTWGLPVNLGGAVVALGMLATGHKPKRFGNCISFEVGKGWGGGSLGMFLFTCKDAPLSLKAHEHGHSIQERERQALWELPRGRGKRH